MADQIASILVLVFRFFNFFGCFAPLFHLHKATISSVFSTVTKNQRRVHIHCNAFAVHRKSKNLDITNFSSTKYIVLLSSCIEQSRDKVWAWIQRNLRYSADTFPLHYFLELRARKYKEIRMNYGPQSPLQENMICRTSDLFLMFSIVVVERSKDDLRYISAFRVAEEMDDLAIRILVHDATFLTLSSQSATAVQDLKSTLNHKMTYLICLATIKHSITSFFFYLFRVRYHVEKIWSWTKWTNWFSR